ncbi:MAG TPA: FTR1 family protein [Rhizomicrobium sp.]|jgi:high-affinity iron transporter
MLSSLIIVFREVIEAGLIIGIVLAATQGVPRRTLWVAYGIAGGLAGACLVAAFADKIGSLFAGNGQELFNASVLLLAVCMLTWHNVWMSGHGRQMAREMKGMGAQVSAGERSLAALAIVVGVAVLREGSEVVLFLYGNALQGGVTAAAMLAGGALGVLAGAAVSALIYFGLLAIPPGRLFDATAGLITLLAAGMAAQAVNWLQQAGFLQSLTTPVWNTSWLLPESGEGWRGILGRLLHTLVGYTDQPDPAQLIAYIAVIAAIVGLMRWEQGRRNTGSAVPKPA